MRLSQLSRRGSNKLPALCAEPKTAVAQARRSSLLSQYHRMPEGSLAGSEIEQAQAHYRAGDWPAAQQLLRRILDKDPHDAPARFLLALCAERAGNAQDAEAQYRQLLAQQPQAIGALTNLGNLLRRQGRAQQAVPLLAQAHALQADERSATNLMLAHIDAGDYAAARALVAQQLELQPQSGVWWEALGALARLQDDIPVAREALERAIALRPHSAATWHEWALLQKAMGDGDAMQDAFARALALAPDWERLQWAQALSVPALVPEDSARWVQHLEQGIARLEQRVAGGDPQRLFDAAGSLVTFNWQFLPHDTSGLQKRFGRLLQQVAQRAYPHWCTLPPRAAGRERVRVGFVGPHWSQHTVSRYFASLVTSLDGARFERFVWHTGPRADARSAALARAVEHFEHARLPVPELAQRIYDAALDVLIFSDVGMHPSQHLLGSFRLAPCQIALYGHPATTGLPNVDLFFSGDALEPADGAAHYSERLCLLPGLGAVPAAPHVEPESEWFTDWRGSQATLVCAQNLSKIIPAFDQALARIAKATGARMVFFEHARQLAPRLLDRLRPSFAAQGLAVESFVHVLPQQTYARFLGALAAADLVLDTPWFSGGATTLDAIAVGAPIVAWELGQARGRQTAGMLRLLELTDWIAQTEDGYVRCVLDLLADPSARQRYAQQLRERAGRLFDNLAVFARFAELLVQATAAQPADAGRATDR